MSSTYLDILKDRLYTFPTDSRLRRGSQTVLLEIVTALAKLMAPILSFTAEEIWQMLPEDSRGKVKSVHMAEFPVPPKVSQSPDLEKEWKYLLNIRVLAQMALEKKRREKVIGSSLEAKVKIQVEKADKYDLLKKHEADLPALFIVSEVEIDPLESFSIENYESTDCIFSPLFGVAISVEKPNGKKCERCWNIRTDVGKQADHPTICGRCVEAVV
jgi:isoleucyl-tRNA synthetase